jgi:hypothetical protein
MAWREVAAGDPGDHLRDQHAEAIRAGHRRPPGEPHHMIFARYLIRCVAYSLQLRKLMQANG